MQNINRTTTFGIPPYAVALILAVALTGILIAQPLNPAGNRSNNAAIAQPSIASNMNIMDDQMIAALKESRMQAQVSSLAGNSLPSQEERYLEKLERLFAPSIIANVASVNAFDDQMIAALKESRVQEQGPSLSGNSYPSPEELYLEKLERLIGSE